jgi:cysteinyl-tRNA synthetase
MVGGEKMSKSLGNFTSLTNLAETSDPRAYRLLVLRSHYRSPVEVTTATIADAERALARLDAFARRFELAALAGDALEVASRHEWMGEGAALYEEVAAVLDDDLKTPLAVAMLFDALAAANTQADAGDATGAQNLAKAINALFGALGLSLHSKEDDVDSRSADLVTRRDAARGAKDWAEADRLRNELVTLGWIVEDSSAGTLIRRP